MPILRAFSDANPLAENWLRSAFEAIADDAVKTKKQLPYREMMLFIQNRSKNPRARRLAYEWLVKLHPKLQDTLIPGLLLDPNPLFRRDAVQQLIDQAKELDETKDAKKVAHLYHKALSGAVDNDQVKIIVAGLKKQGEEVDLQAHFGFLTQWKVIGPFDNKEKKGYAVAYPPEKELKLSAKYEGQLGEVSWDDVSTKDDYGIVDIATEIKNYKGSVMYLTTEFVSGKDQNVQLRLGTPNAWKMWVNGELVFAREEYHRGTALDQYQVPAKLKKGPNVILLKVCQNEQEDSWAQRYQFQLRVTDEAGSAIAPASEKSTQLNRNSDIIAGGVQ